MVLPDNFVRQEIESLCRKNPTGYLVSCSSELSFTNFLKNLFITFGACQREGIPLVIYTNILLKEFAIIITTFSYVNNGNTGLPWWSSG